MTLQDILFQVKGSAPLEIKEKKKNLTSPMLVLAGNIYMRKQIQVRVREKSQDEDERKGKKIKNQNDVGKNKKMRVSAKYTQGLREKKENKINIFFKLKRKF